MKLKAETITPQTKVKNFLESIGAKASTAANGTVTFYDVSGSGIAVRDNGSDVEIYAQCPHDSYEQSFKWIRSMAKKAQKVSAPVTQASESKSAEGEQLPA